MIDLTVEQISAAASSDLGAITDVLTALEPRIGQLANKYASSGGNRNADLAEELEQEGRIAAWQCIERFQGETVAQFFSYVDRSLKGVMDDQRRTETRRGVSEDTAARFERCLSVCAGDPYAAQSEAVRPDGVLGRERMSVEMAYAARLSWQGMEYLDTPLAKHNGHGPGSEHMTLADYVAATQEPEYGYSESDRSKAIRHQVRDTLTNMGRQQAFVLRATYGIEPVGQMERDAQIAEALGVAETRITVIRSKGKDRFRELYLAGATPEVAA